jgi:hypothetical protein
VVTDGVDDIENDGGGFTIGDDITGTGLFIGGKSKRGGCGTGAVLAASANASTTPMHSPATSSNNVSPLAKHFLSNSSIIDSRV